MPRSPSISALLLVLSASGLHLGSITVRAQTAGDTTQTREVTVESADLLDVDQVDGEEVSRLEGNVRLRQETTRLSADRAVQYSRRKLIVFEGDVEIVDEGDTLRADQIEYRTDTKIAYGRGEVVWTDGEVELEAPVGEYTVDARIASFEGGVVMRDSSSVIFSESGVYDVEHETATFTSQVRLDQESLTLTADSLTHERSTGHTTAAGGVRIYQAPRDTARARVVLLAGRAESERESGVNRLWVNPLLARMDHPQAKSEGKRDTLIVTADRLEVSTSDSVDSFQAVGGVRMWRPDLAGTADSLSYSSRTEADSGAVVLAGQPILWSGGAQVSGDTIRVELVGGAADSLISSGNAFVAFEDTTTGRIQQIKGSRLVAAFQADSLRSLVVRPQAEALYFGEDDGDAESPADEDESAVHFSASSIRLTFVGGEVVKIVASTDVSGEITTFNPENPPALEGFRWLAPTRPDRRGVLEDRLLEALRQWPDGTGSD